MACLYFLSDMSDKIFFSLVKKIRNLLWIKKGFFFSIVKACWQNVRYLFVFWKKKITRPHLYLFSSYKHNFCLKWYLAFSSTDLLSLHTRWMLIMLTTYTILIHVLSVYLAYDCRNMFDKILCEKWILKYKAILFCEMSSFWSSAYIWKSELASLNLRD